MKPDEINIAIAEICGWRIAERVAPEAKLEACMCWIRPGGNEWQEERLPDYHGDLNAMHEAEEHIKDWPKWVKMVAKVIAGVPESSKASGTTVSVANSILLRATAAQRAEAFLRTLSLWKE